MICLSLIPPKQLIMDNLDIEGYEWYDTPIKISRVFKCYWTIKERLFLLKNVLPGASTCTVNELEVCFCSLDAPDGKWTLGGIINAII
jgi:hypothetical protein